MEITTLIIGIIIGVVLGALLLYFILKSGNVPRKDFDELNQSYIKVNSDLQNSNLRISELNDSVQKEKEKKDVPWGNVKSGVIVGIVVGVVMLGINIFITYQILGGK